MPGTGDVTKEKAIEFYHGPFGKVMRELATSGRNLTLGTHV